MSNKGGRRQTTQTTIPAAMQTAPPVAGAGAAASRSGEDGMAGDATGLTNESFKRELLETLRSDFVKVMKEEVRSVLETEMAAFRQEFVGMKTGVEEFKNTVNTELARLDTTLGEAERSWSKCSDDVTNLQAEVERLTTLTESLLIKCEDLESRSRRNNVRIVGVPEDPQHSTPAFVGNLLEKAFEMEGAVLVDRSHRSLRAAPKPGDPPRVIIARLHYYSDCEKILSLARKTRQKIKVDNMTISVFPDYTASVAKARAAFNGLRDQLRGLQGVRYGIAHPARFRVTYNGVEKVFVDSKRAQTYVTQKIMPHFPPAASLPPP